MIQYLTGTVERGHGSASINLVGSVLQLIEQRIGLSELIPGTLNLRLKEPFYLAADATLEPPEYNSQERIQLQRCRVGGIQAIIMRAELAVHGRDHLEIMAAPLAFINSATT